MDSFTSEMLDSFASKELVIEKKFATGMAAFTWMVMGSFDAFIKDCLKHVARLRSHLTAVQILCNN